MTMEHETRSLRKTARLAGLLYFIWVITGIYALMYVTPQTIVRGDAAATANKILANELVFRMGIMNDIISSAIWVFLVMALYRLFKQVNIHQAQLLVALVIIQIPAVFFMEALNITALLMVKGDMIETFEPGQRQEVALLLWSIADRAAIPLEMYWGLWLLPFGLLVYKSGFIPRILGIFLLLNGITYMIHCYTHIFLPDYRTLVFNLSVPFWILGEISITLWLLVIGVKIPPPRPEIG